MGRRRERGFIQMFHILGITAWAAVTFVALSSARDPSKPAIGFAATAIACGIAAFVVSFFAAPAYPRYYDPGSLGCLALWIPEIAAIAGGGIGAREIARAAGAENVHWFALAGALLGMVAFTLACRLAWRLLPPPKKD